MDCCHFEKKTVKSPYLCNRLTDFDETWYGDPKWVSQPPTVKTFDFQKSKTADGRHFTNR